VASSKSWLLFGVLLAFTIAASWPTGTSALPRRSRGSELAWHRRGGDAVTTTERSLPHVHLPHRRYNTPNPVKRFRKHRRTTRDLKVQIFPTTPKPNTHASEDIVQVVIVNISMTETLNRGQCAWKMSDTTLFAARLKTAFDVVQDTKEAIVCLIDEWLDYSSNQTMEQALHEIKLHRLLLEHPLKKEVEHVEFIDHTYKYQGSVGSPKDEMPRILAALNVLDNFVKHLNLTGKFGAASRAFTHKYISEKITHNLVKALELSHLQECATPDYTFNSNHARLEFAAYNETLKVLTVVEHMYRHWTAESK
ncbi:hypothetical protein KR074_009311, partial [Drosophila pseudoananassae]